MTEITRQNALKLIEKGLAGTVAAAVAGCGGNYYDYMGLAGQMGAQNPRYTMQQRQGFATLGGFFGRMGERQHELDVAREGRSEVNVYPGGGQQITAKIAIASLEYNVSLNDMKGMKVHSACRVMNKRGCNLEAVACFCNSDGSALKDTDGVCSASNGQVATHFGFVPKYDDTSYGIWMFIPYSQLHCTQKGKYTLGVKVQLQDHSQEQPVFLAESQDTWFTFTKE